MKIGSLFSGVGGIELGFEREGFKTEWFVEIEPYCQAVLKKNFPNTPVYGDVTKIDFKKLEPVEILTGGFPCQDISNAGQRKGIEGKRSGLWKEFFRAIGEIRPRIAFVENVSALTYRGLLVVLGDLASIGYDAEWHCVPASAFGAPHRRDRIYILAYANGQRWSGRDLVSQRETQDGSKTPGRSGDANNFFNSNGKQLFEESEFAEQGEDVSHSLHNGWNKKTNKWSGAQNPARSFPNTNYYYYWQQCKESLRKKNRRETWATDAGILRVANGVPNRVDRIKGIGNAVVPQVSQFFAKMIKERFF